MTDIICFSICAQKTPDFINCGAAFLLKMGSHDISCAANRSLYLRWRLLHFGISQLMAGGGIILLGTTLIPLLSGLF